MLAELRSRLTSGSTSALLMCSSSHGRRYEMDGVADDGLGRYVVSVNVIVEATSEEEASTMIERNLAGRFEHQIVDVFAEDPDQQS
jgi:hypothetical protein